MKRIQNIRLLISKAAVLLMFSVFFSITMVQAIHSHTSYTDEDNDNTEAIHASEKCCVCDYLLHKQSRHTTESLSQSTILLPVTVTSFPAKPINSTTQRSRHQYTDRGPPGLFCA